MKHNKKKINKVLACTDETTVQANKLDSESIAINFMDVLAINSKTTQDLTLLLDIKSAKILCELILDRYIKEPYGIPEEHVVKLLST